MRVAIIDDEPLARDLLRRHVSSREDLLLVGEAGSGMQAARIIEGKTPEAVFLDIQMPEGDAFETLAALVRSGARVPMIVFVTAYDRYAVRAFEMNAVDYLLKPVSRERFSRAVDRCLSRTWRSAENIAGLLEDTLRRPPCRILVRHQGRIVPVAVESIDFVQAAGDYVTIHAEGHEHLLERTLHQMEALLAPKGFSRIHRSLLINIRRIRELAPLGSSRYEAVLTDGTRLPVSRSHSASLRERLR